MSASEVIEGLGQLLPEELEYTAGLILERLEGGGAGFVPYRVSDGGEKKRAGAAGFDSEEGGEAEKERKLAALEAAFARLVGAKEAAETRSAASAAPLEKEELRKSGLSAETGGGASEAGRDLEDGEREAEAIPAGEAFEGRTPETRAAPLLAEETPPREKSAGESAEEAPFLTLRRGENGAVFSRRGSGPAAPEPGQAGIENSAFTRGGTEAAALKTLEMSRVSEFFRRDSRRYDNGFERY